MMRNLNNQKRIALAGALAIGTAVIALPAMAKDTTQHLRGQITAVSDSGFTMTTRAGDKRQIMVSSKARISTVTKGDLSNIEKGTFIGTANVPENGENRALEMVIFPASMKGTGEGDYGWDLSPSMADQSASDTGTPRSGGSLTSNSSSMTNGTVSSKTGGSVSTSDSPRSSDGLTTNNSSMTNGTVSSKTSGTDSSGETPRSAESLTADSSSMTNGTVSSKMSGSGSSDSSTTNSAGSQSSGGGQSITLNVDYGKGSKKIVVPADTPTVKVHQGSKSDLKKGAHVFVAGPQSSGEFNAKMVIVGKNGTVPPM